MKKILIIGASSFIGSRLYIYLKTIKQKLEIVGTYYSNKLLPELIYLDITNLSSLKSCIINKKFDFIILFSGIKDLKSCESDYNKAYILNYMQIKYIIDIIESNKLDTKVIFMSSDYVFDGLNGNYTDKDMPNPNTNYGRTKFLAEQALSKSNINYKIIRSSAVMGKGGVFFDWFLEQLNNSDEIELFNNVYFTPTLVLFLCEMIYKLLIDFDTIHENVLHIVGEKRMSRYEFGKIVYEFYRNSLNMKINVKLIPKEIELEHTFFRRDLSMIPSEFVKKQQNRKFEDYIKEEILNV